ncbi:aspartate aminotransferase family protein [Ktedonosporobacter rubrisoli]|uniref:Aspartate aminotransferase family protein n=1 Tax=Ktedonosporobacter rubrisoli TaxID=2509675 RepID=A0A4P6JVR2_KTERU|nr:aspartate aminotransferase family protein [Ktedonosporobacter rubrisoli]QBD79066.1 aspartate aminotransferase family protein [Ktedonosporobacter rubrisoli]
MYDERERFLIRYSRDFAPFTVTRASGAWVETSDGRRILDFTSGQICSTIGHNHPGISAAIQQALESVIHLNSWMLSEPVLQLAEKLVKLAPASLNKVVLLNTGAESNEVALRLAKMHTARFEVVGLTRSWHGLQAGVASLNLTGGHAGYGPLMPGTFALPAPYAYRCPIRHCNGNCDCTCMDTGFELIDQQSVGSLCAVLAEPVLSAGGVIVPPADYFQRLKQHCAERGMLLIIDEAQTGFGRLGAMFGFELYQIEPDLFTVSKTLGGGVPLAATFTTAEIEDDCYNKGFLHVTSHISDPLPAFVGLAVLEVILNESLVEQAQQRGQYLLNSLQELQRQYEQFGDVRGQGLLVGVELVEDRTSKKPAVALAQAITDECLRQGLSMNIIRSIDGAANCWRIAPPLSITENEIDTAIEIIEAALKTVLATSQHSGSL